MMNNNTILKCNSLTVGYDRKAIVSDINIKINKGEIVTIIGENGAGKSTLLRTIAGFLPIIYGTVLIDEIELSTIPKKELSKKISVLLTDKIHSDFMTCFDVISTGRYAYTNGLGLLSSDDKEAIDNALIATDTKDLKDTLFDKLSDGQKQRVMLARAICQNPEIIILDEPTSFLDIGYKIEIMSILKDLSEKGITVIMTMHDLDIAKKISDKVISIKDGKIDRIGTTDELLSENYLCHLFNLNIEKYREYYE